MLGVCFNRGCVIGVLFQSVHIGSVIRTMRSVTPLGNHPHMWSGDVSRFYLLSLIDWIS